MRGYDNEESFEDRDGDAEVVFHWKTGNWKNAFKDFFMAKTTKAAAEVAETTEIATQVTSPKSSTAIGTANPMASLMASIGVDAGELKGVLQAANAAVDKSALQVSRVQIAQSNTPEVADEKVKVGSLMDSSTKDVYSFEGPAPWLLARGVEAPTMRFGLFLPIFNLLTEYVKWPSKEEREAGAKAFHWKSLDLMEERVQEGLWRPKGKWKGTGSPPVTETLNVIGIFLNPTTFETTSNPIILSWSRTSFQNGRRFITQCCSHENSKLPNFFGRSYFLFTEQAENAEKQKYRVLNSAKGFSLPELCGGGNDVVRFEELFHQCFNMTKMFTDEVNGRRMQEQYLNVAQFADDGDDSGDGAVSGSSEGGTTADDTTF